MTQLQTSLAHSIVSVMPYSSQLRHVYNLATRKLSVRVARLRRTDGHRQLLDHVKRRAHVEPQEIGRIVFSVWSEGIQRRVVSGRGYEVDGPYVCGAGRHNGRGRCRTDGRSRWTKGVREYVPREQQGELTIVSVAVGNELHLLRRIRHCDGCDLTGSGILNILEQHWLAERPCASAHQEREGVVRIAVLECVSIGFAPVSPGIEDDEIPYILKVHGIRSAILDLHKAGGDAPWATRRARESHLTTAGGERERSY